MILCIGPVEDRIISWKHYREYLTTLDYDSMIDNAINVWSNSPKINKQKYNLLDFNSWPNPWQLLTETAYNTFEQTLGLYYTLCLTCQKNGITFEFEIAEDKSNQLFSRITNNFDEIYIDNIQELNKVINTYTWNNFKGKIE